MSFSEQEKLQRQRDAMNRAYAEKPQKFKDRVRAWRIANPAKYQEQLARAAVKRAQPEHKEQARIRTREWTRAKTEKLAGRPRPEGCEVCGQKSQNGYGLHFDHDHKTGEFRGWLCHCCNVALGLVNDDTDRLDALIVYLSRSRRPRLVVVAK